ncbi:MAG: N-acetyltransferase [Desulfocapsaceae bacterium]|nr:N-acetyltransferase [Desulfocapsaceae bacterium]
MPEKIEVRPAKPEDADWIVDFNLKMARETEGRKLDPEVLGRGVQAVFSQPERGFYLIAMSGSKVVGCLLITTEWSDWRNGEFWWLQSVYVDKEFRRRGVFKAMYAEARKRAEQSENVCGFRLYVEQENGRAQQTYNQLGMKETAYRVMEALF